MLKSLKKEDIHKLNSGQVITSLQNVLKELVENSIDANATKIEINFINYGLNSIELIDNGDGIDESDFDHLAVSHSTSKLRTFEDLSSVKTLGFRGEAINSLCSISNLSITTTKVEPKAYNLKFGSFGELVQKTVVSRSKGTTVSISNLFNNLPVRQLNLKKNIKREFGKALSLITCYILISTGIKFKVTNNVNGKKTLLNSQGLDLKTNILDVFGSNGLFGLVDIASELQVKTYTVKVTGMISKASFGFGRSVSDRQFWYLNKRPIQLSKFSKLINEVYKEFNQLQLPCFILDIELEEHFDLNVTPDKQTILFHNELEFLDSLRLKLLEFFNSFDLTIQKNLVQRDVDTFTNKRFAAEPAEAEEEETKPSLKRKKFEYKGPTEEGLEEDLDEDKEEEGDDLHEDLQQDIEKDEVTTAKSLNSQNGLADDIENTPYKPSLELVEDADEIQQIRELEATPRNKARNVEHLNEQDEDLELDEDVHAGNVLDEEYEEELEDDTKRGKTSRNDLFIEQSEDEEEDSEGDTEQKIEKEPQERPARRSIQPTSHKTRLTNIKELSSFANNPSSPSTPKQAIRKQALQPVILKIGNEETIHDAYMKNDKLTFDSCDCDHEEHAKEAIDVDSDTEDKYINEEEYIQNYSTSVTMPKLFSSPLSSKSDVKDIKINDHIEDQSVSDEFLTLTISKDDFNKMKIIGQFNLGFILVMLNFDLFIIDQHASDEIFNFEDLQKTTILQTQKLIKPIKADLNKIDELIVSENIEIFEQNGFRLSNNGSIVINSLPISKNKTFDLNDFSELIHLIKEQPLNKHPKISKLRSMFAMRACRKSIMIGRHLNLNKMTKVVRNLGTLDKPWNCPHGRPTMRHLMELKQWETFNEDYTI